MLVNTRGQVKLCDFGVSTQVNPPFTSLPIDVIWASAPLLGQPFIWNLWATFPPSEADCSLFHGAPKCWYCNYYSPIQTWLRCSSELGAFCPDKREGRARAVSGEPDWPRIEINIGSNNGAGLWQWAAPILINFHFGAPWRAPRGDPRARCALIWISAPSPPSPTPAPKRRSAWEYYGLAGSAVPPVFKGWIGDLFTSGWEMSAQSHSIPIFISCI